MADPNEGRHIDGSTIGLGEPILTPHMNGQRSVAVAINPVFNGDREVGWIEKSDRGETFYRENLATRATFGASISAGPLSASLSETPGVPVKLDPSKTVADQIPTGAVVRPGISVAHEPGQRYPTTMEDGKSFAGSPFALGERIPDPAHPGSFVKITDINAVVNKDDGLIRGYLYGDANGKVYSQQVDNAPLSFSVGAANVGVSVTPAVQGDIRMSEPVPGCINYTIPPPFLRNDRIPMHGDTPLGVQHLRDLFKHGNVTLEVQDLKDGQRAFGTVLAKDDNTMVVNGGRIAWAVPTDRLPPDQTPAVGDKVEVALKPGNEVATVNIMAPGATHDIGVGRA